MPGATAGVPHARTAAIATPGLPLRPSDVRARRYTRSQLIEVNAHSLFSKWFSESGKLVSKLFATIVELLEEPECLVFVLIDEVESLSSARKVRSMCLAELATRGRSARCLSSWAASPWA
jgi:SpoVK/Ycf46/Vps4 family AAA+-type ATPase